MKTRKAKIMALMAAATLSIFSAGSVMAAGTVLQFKGNVDDLVLHEQAYAPPVGASRDAVCILGAVAQNVCDGLMQIARFDELETRF